MSITKQQKRFMNSFTSNFVKGKLSRNDLILLREFPDKVFLNNAIKLISKNRQHFDRLHGYLFPHSYNQIHFLSPLPPITPENEILWIDTLLETNKDKIYIFLELEEQYQSYFLHEDYDSCSTVLEKIQEVFGQSIWLIKNKITILQRYKGLKEQKEYTAAIEADSNNPLLNYIIFYHSLCAEEAVGYFSYLSFIEQNMSATIEKDLRAYIRSHIIPLEEKNHNDILTILRYSYRSSLIDMYCAYKIYFPIINNIEYKNDVNNNGNQNKESPDEIINLIDTEKSALAIEKIKRHLTASPKDLQFLELLLRLDKENGSVSDLPVALSKVFDGLYDIREGRSNAFYAIDSLSKLASLNSSSSWGRYLYVLTAQHVDFYGENGHWLKDGIAFNNLLGSSMFYEYSSLDTKKYQEEENNVYSGLLHKHKMLILGCLSKDEIDNESTKTSFGTEYIATTLLNFNEYELSLDILESYIDKNNTIPFYILNYKAVCLANIGNLDDLLLLISNCAVEDINRAAILPLVSCKRLLDAKNVSSCDSIHQLIFLHVFSTNFKGDFDGLKREWLDDFLYAHNIDKPSEIISISDKIEEKYLIFFLRNICAEQNIDTLPCFSTTAEVSDERIKICKILSEIDSKNDEVYQDEISNILRINRIKTRLRGIEKSKVYVDLNKLKSVSEKEISDDFTRLKALAGTKDGEAIAQLFSKAQQKILSGAQLAVLELPTNEIYSLFVKIILKLTDLFISNTEYGLDGYLSVRIRHGTLSGLLRTPLEELHVITTRDSGGKNYKENIYWKAKKNWPTGVWENIDKTLNEFSHSYDTLLNQILSEYIQVKKTPDDSNGLFDFTTQTTSLLFLYTLIAESHSVEQFVSKVFDEYLILKLNQILKSIQLIFKNELKTKATNLIDSALLSIDEYCPDHTYPANLLIANLITAKTNISNAFDHASEWFVYSDVLDMEVFSIQDVIDVSEQNVKVTYPKFSVRIEYDFETDLTHIAANYFHIADIFYNIFQNIAKHCGKDTEQIANISVTLRENYLIFTIINKISENIINSEYEEKIARIQDAISSGHYMDYIKTEKGTGICKIFKILTHNISSKSKFKFGVNNEKLEFRTTIEIPIRLLESHDESIDN